MHLIDDYLRQARRAASGAVRAATEPLGRAVITGVLVFAGVFLVDVLAFTTSDNRLSRPVALLLFWWLVAFGPLIGGLATGALVPTRAVPGTALAFGLLASGFVWLDAVASTDPGEWKGVLLAFAVISLPLACLGARIGRRLRAPASRTLGADHTRW